MAADTIGEAASAPMPSFVCVGVEKCGTTSLHRMLDQHPDVYLGRFKEHFFFNREFDRGIDWYRDRYNTWEGQRLVGDITPSYFRNPKSYDRIHELCGADTKGILVLRQPLIRAWSHYNHQLLRAKFDVGFEETFDHPLIDVDYVRVVRRFQNDFGDRGMTLIYEDDLVADPLVAARLVGDHLGITIDGVESRWSNRGMASHYQVIERGQVLETDQGPMVADADALVFTSRPELSEVILGPTSAQIAEARGRQAQWTRSLEAASVQPMTDSVFGTVVDDLESLLGRTLDSWRSVGEPPTYDLAPLPAAVLKRTGAASPQAS